jgi:hypothetical protein
LTEFMKRTLFLKVVGERPTILFHLTKHTKIITRLEKKEQRKM